MYEALRSTPPLPDNDSGATAEQAQQRNYEQQWAHNFAPSRPPAVRPTAEACEAAAAARQAQCKLAAAGGVMDVRCSWGHTQEAASLHALMQIFPQSVVEEVSGLLP